MVKVFQYFDECTPSDQLHYVKCNLFQVLLRVNVIQGKKVPNHDLGVRFGPTVQSSFLSVYMFLFWSKGKNRLHILSFIE